MTMTSSAGARDAAATPPAVIRVDTGKVAGRRELHFATLADLVADVDHLADLDRAARLQQLGNWTLGQTLGHLAAWNNFPFDGYPLKEPPLPIKLILRLSKRRFFRGPMPAGVKIPGIDGGTKAFEPLETDEGLHRFHRAIERLRSTPPPLPNPIFGHLSHDEWMTLALRHGELHLSFFKPT